MDNITALVRFSHSLLLNLKNAIDNLGIGTARDCIGADVNKVLLGTWIDGLRQVVLRGALAEGGRAGEVAAFRSERTLISVGSSWWAALDPAIHIVQIVDIHFIIGIVAIPTLGKLARCLLYCPRPTNLTGFFCIFKTSRSTIPLLKHNRVVAYARPV